ncbi:urease accessory protein UreD [Cohnella sp. AR92]|uniref:urease accessory protein UreD n=1 Tax=Cohnella sp. AR92 TaxID=648716 RepID=UPI000F8F4A17|nr:urease accessory protein UreD [Cohnella sp. AR92]RUS48623.1 urease accessory protein UreD [Cohnella sp. AR92]
MRPPVEADRAEAGETSLLKVRAELAAAVSLVAGKPELTSRYHTAPLKIAKTFALRDEAGPQLAVVQMDVSPGLLDGDRYFYDWTVGAGARLYATNQAYTRVHPCPDSDARAEQRFRLGRGAVLEWLPEPVMLFRGAKYRCDTQVELEPESVCMLADLFCPGRIARGEVFGFDRCETSLSVRYQGELIHHQRQRWLPGQMDLKAPGCFGTKTHLGSLSIFSDRLDGPAIAAMTAQLEESGLLADDRGEVKLALARTARHGLVAMLVGNRTWQVQRAMQEVWDAARLVLFGASPVRLLKGG